jgi:ligand-binding sensor domain-containing protein
MPVFRLSRRWSSRCGLCTAVVLAVGLLALCFYLSAVAPRAMASRPSQPSGPGNGGAGQTSFSYEDGLVANSVTALLRDDRALWVGTMAGLSRYPVRGREAGIVWQTFTQEDGMAADAVSDLWSDDAGRVWVAHPDRQISLFDGDSWTTYESVTQTLTQAYKQIVDTNAAGPLWAIEEGGRVWTLAGGTVGYYVGSVWRPYGEDAGLPRGRLVAVWTAGGAWVAAESGQIGYFDGATWTTYRDVFDAVQRHYETIAASGPMVGPLWVVDQEGAVWVRNAFNQRNPRPDVRRFAEGRWVNFGSNDGMATGFVAELRLDDYGRVWARHVADADGQGGGLSLYNGEPSTQRIGATTWSAFVPAFSSNVTGFWPEGTDGVWIGSYMPAAGTDISAEAEAVGVAVGGLTYVALDTWQRFSLEALGGAAVSATWLDENNTLWLGLTSDARRGLEGGLWRYQPPQGIRSSRWTRFEGLLGDDVRDLWGDSMGNLWVATPGGVNRITLDSRKLLTFTQPVDIDRIAGDAAGNVWAAALGEEGGVWQWDGSAWVSHTVTDGLSGGAYAAMRASADGRVYLGGDRGLDIWEGEEWETFAALPGRHVTGIWQDGLGDLWLSSEITPGRPFNLSLYHAGSWQTVLNENASRGMGAEPLALLRDSRGQAWMGTPLGLFVYQPDGDARWRGVGPVEGLAAGAVPALFEDDSRTLWVANGEQVYRIDHLSCGQASTGMCGERRLFEPRVGAVSRVAAGPDGSVLFAGEAGVALYQPERPDLRLEDAVNAITGEATERGEPVVLTIGRNAVRADLAVVAPTWPARQISLRYRMEGVGRDWRVVPARALGGKQASITYAGLAGGVYTFTFAARTEDLDSSPEESLSVYVLSRPPRLFIDTATVAGRPVEQLGSWQSQAGQPIAIRLNGDDDQPAPLTVRYRIEGLGDDWTETTAAEISFTLTAGGTYTFVATALDDEGQSSPLVAAQIVVTEGEQGEGSSGLPVEAIAAGMGVLAVFFIGSAILLMLRRRRRESW